MARYRIRVRPNPEVFSANAYDVEECVQMTNASKTEVFDYWSFLETFDSFERAELYIEACISADCVVKVY